MSSLPSLADAKPKWSIPTRYGKILLRSKLESTYAAFFDQHRIKWLYEPEGFDVAGVRYLPDFYLPQISTVVEVKGILDGTDESKLAALASVAEGANVMVVLAQAGEWFQRCYSDVDFMGRRKWVLGLSDQPLVRCFSCHNWYFLDVHGSWECRHCGNYGGNMSFDLVHPGAVEWRGDACPDCGECGM